MIRLYDEYDEAVIERELAYDDVATVVERGSVWVRNGDGDVEELLPVEHPGFVPDGSVFAWHPDEGDAEEATFAGPMGHIGDSYFVWWFDDWRWLGSATTAEKALDLLRDSVGVLDSSWIYLEATNPAG